MHISSTKNCKNVSRITETNPGITKMYLDWHETHSKRRKYFQKNKNMSNRYKNLSRNTELHLNNSKMFLQPQEQIQELQKRFQSRRNMFREGQKLRNVSICTESHPNGSEIFVHEIVQNFIQDLQKRIQDRRNTYNAVGHFQIYRNA